MTLLAFQIKMKIIALLNVHYENGFIQKCYAPMSLFFREKDTECSLNITV